MTFYTEESLCTPTDLNFAPLTPNQFKKLAVKNEDDLGTAELFMLETLTKTKQQLIEEYQNPELCDYRLDIELLEQYKNYLKTFSKLLDVALTRIVDIAPAVNSEVAA